MKKRILILTDKLNYSCGVTTYLYNLLTELKYNDTYEFHLISPGGDAVDKFKKLNMKLVINKLFIYKKHSFAKAAYNVFFLLRYVLNNHISIVHSQNYYVANIASIVSKFIKIKTVQTHNNLFQEKKLRHFVSDKHIAVNDHIIEYALKNNVNKENIKLIRYGVKSYSHIAKTDYTKINVLCASRLIYEKGPDIYVKAVASLPKDIKEKTNFMLAGIGKEEKKIMALNSEYNAGIKFLGNLKGLNEILTISHIFVMPTRWNSEGFPYTIIEAGCFKNFVITSDFFGVNSVFEDNIDGFVFEVNNYIQLSDKLKYAINNLNILQGKINCFNTKVKKVFNVKKMANETLLQYHELLQ